MDADLVIVGAGPAGLAVAIEAVRRGLTAVVCERRPALPDKACGEGVSHRGVRWLDEQGVLRLIAPEAKAPLLGVRFVQDGAACQAPFRRGPALGIRRTVLEAALWQRATTLGAKVELGCAVRQISLGSGGVEVATDRGTLCARLLVGADGLGSLVRRASGIRVVAAPSPRYGIRRHFRVRRQSPWVEVHWAQDRTEAYLTPIGPRTLGVAILWDRTHSVGIPSFERLLGRFPPVLQWLQDAPPQSQVLGAGPFGGRADRVVSDRVVLVGDAAGSVDAISGEGISLAFECAQALGALLPNALDRGASRQALARYGQSFAWRYRAAHLAAAFLLQWSHHPRARHYALRAMARRPWLMRPLLAWSER